jgi:hypothetical protein
MCGLCGSLQGSTHWSDGAPFDGGREILPAWRRRAERRARVAAANHVLSLCGLTLKDWQGARYVLSSRTGAVAEVSGFGDLWSQADRLCAIAPDPLDPDFLDRLAHRHD